MSGHAYTEDQLVGRPAAGLFAGLDWTVPEGLRELSALCLEELVVKGEVAGYR